MKKIIWLFGQPGSGRKTLINNILNDSNNIKELFDISGLTISIANLRYDRDCASSNFEFMRKRKDDIYKYINDFMNDDNDALIIEGEYVDYSEGQDSILKTIITDFSNIEGQIVILLPSSLEIAFDRLKKTEWFQSNYEKNLNKFPKEWLDFANKYMKKSLDNFKLFGYEIYELDTNDGYTLINKENTKKCK